MGVVIQEIAGKKYDDLFYPDFSGVVRDINFFPVSHMEREDGIAYVALGLGKAIMEGGNALQFSPKHPNILPQFSATDFSIKNTQREFFAIDLAKNNPMSLHNEDDSLRRVDLARAQKDGTLDALGSTYIVDNDIIKDGVHYEGLKFVSFAHILKSDVFPLADILTDVINIGKNGLGSSVEIEFAVELAKKPNEKHIFYFLQIRPMIAGKEQANIELKEIDNNKLLCRSAHALGNGVIENIKDIIYVKPENFDPANSNKIAEEIGKINFSLEANAMFVGLGRWGTSDHWLGIPVNWGQISKAGVLIEVALEKFNIDPSHGSHFFHNISSLGIGYFTIPANKKEEFIDWEWLNSQKSFYESDSVKHIKLKKPLEIILNGRKGLGIIVKPN